MIADPFQAGECPIDMVVECAFPTRLGSQYQFLCPGYWNGHVMRTIAAVDWPALETDIAVHFDKYFHRATPAGGPVNPNHGAKPIESRRQSIANVAGGVRTEPPQVVGLSQSKK